jgi:A/G-specific adenine glycosylase
MPAKKSAKTFPFAQSLLAWFDTHGRKNLPWQHDINPYRVWLSEIMLQQTQVDTVIPYFNTFMEHFPTVHTLAAAPLDEVLHLWTGLGYYARARNLHRCAQLITEHHQGEFPSDIDQLVELPGIGPSTACAIASIAFNQPTAILDGNVKRVLARFHCLEGWPGSPKIEKELWLHAQAHMPIQRCADYTQAIMDLGATLCRRASPDCDNCPVQKGCAALKHIRVQELPTRKPSKAVPTKTTIMLLAIDAAGRVLLHQRPPEGIWGGLWSLPEFDTAEDAISHCSYAVGTFTEHQEWPQLKHVFSHYKLNITPIVISVKPSAQVAEHQNKRWYKLGDSQKLGLAAPVKKLLEKAQTLGNKSQ